MKKQLLILYAILFAIMTYSQSSFPTVIKGNAPKSSGTQKEILATIDGSLRLEASGSIKIFAGAFLTAKNEITNLGDGANFIVESDANLVQVNDAAVNAGNLTSKRDLKIGANRTQYNYLGSPVAFADGQTFKTIYAGASFVLYYNETNNLFYNSSGVNIPGRGLAVKEPTGTGATTVTAAYRGLPQNGTINFGIVNGNLAGSSRGYNLIGNPYPSNIDLVKLYNLNGGKNTAPQTVSPNISATFYFWDNEVNNGVAGTQQGSSYNGQAYGIFNVLTGTNGTGTAAGSLNNNITGTKTPNRVVKVAQGFMTRSLVSNYSLLFDNSIRTSEVPPVDFLGKGGPTQDDRYWLKMITPANLTSNIAVVYFGAGQNSFGAEDSESRGGSDELYSSVDAKRAAINGKSSFEITDLVPLGTKHFADGPYRLSLGQREGVFANGQKVYLKDRQAGIITNLSEGDYTFTAIAGESTGRFEIIYRPESTLSTDATVTEELIVYRDGHNFVVKAQREKITDLEVYDASGRLIYQTKPKSTKALINADLLTNGIYILKIHQNGQVTGKKILK